MNLLKFLIFALILSTFLGEFGKLPFGSSPLSVSLTDTLAAIIGLTWLVWLVQTRTRILLPKPFKLLVSFWLVALFSQIVSLKEVPVSYFLVGFLYWLRFVIYSSLGILIFNLLSAGQPKWVNTKFAFHSSQLINIFLRAGLIFTVLGFLQLLILPDFTTSFLHLTDYGFDPHHNRLTSTFLDPNFAGAFLVFNLGVLLHQFLISKNRWFIFWGLVELIALILTFSRSAYLMFAVSTIFIVAVCWRQINLKAKILGAILILLLGLALDILMPKFYQRLEGGFNVDASAFERVASWENGITLFQQNPIFGVGFNNLRYALSKNNLLKVYSSDGGHAGNGVDSSFLVVLATTGVAGGVLFLGFYVCMLYFLIKRKTAFSLVLSSLLVGYFVNSQFINSFFFPNLMVFFYGLLGVGVKEVDEG